MAVEVDDMLKRDRAHGRSRVCRPVERTKRQINAARGIDGDSRRTIQHGVARTYIRVGTAIGGHGGIWLQNVAGRPDARARRNAAGAPGSTLIKSPEVVYTASPSKHFTRISWSSYRGVPVVSMRQSSSPARSGYLVGDPQAVSRVEGGGRTSLEIRRCGNRDRRVHLDFLRCRRRRYQTS